MSRWIIAALFMAAVAAGCQGQQGGGARDVEVAVTDKGFEPSRIEVKKGDVVTLVVTRKSDQTCATEMVVADRGIRQALPLNQPVRLAIGPIESGEVTFVCGMDMLKGSVVAQ